MTEPSIQNQINAYFISHDKSFTYADVLRVRAMRVGKRKLSMQQQADELGGMSRSTLYSWHKRIDEQV